MQKKVVITGAAGLGGQNLIPRLASKRFTFFVAIDKHPINTAILQKNYPSVRLLKEDLAMEQDGKWKQELAGSDALVIAHAQIGGSSSADFVRNNVNAT